MAAESTDRSTVRDLMTGGLRQVVAALASFVVFPVLTRVLDDQELGAWSLIAAGAVVLGLSELGLTTAIQRATVTDDHALARRTFGLSMMTICVVVPIAILLAVTVVLDFREVAPALRHDAHIATAIALAAGGLAAVLVPVQGYSYARGGAREIARARISAVLVQMAIILTGFVWRASVIVPAVGMLAAYATELFISVRAARRLDPELSLLPRIPSDRDEVKRAFRDGAAQLAINAAVVVALRIDLFIVQWASERQELAHGATVHAAATAALPIVGLYALAGRTVDQAYLMPKQANTALMRRLGNPQDRPSALRIGTGAFSGLIVSGMFALAVTSRQLLVFILGQKAASPIVWTVLPLLATAAMLLSTYEIASSVVMLGSKSAWVCARPIVTGACVHLAIAFAFASTHPVIAVAGSTILGNATTMLLMWRRARGLVEWPYARVARALAPPFSAAIVAGTLAFVLRSFSAAGPLQSLVSCLVVTGSGYGTNILALRRLGTPVAPTPTEEAAK